MKKRTDEEELQMINEACELVKEGCKTLREAQKMFHLCGIEICNYMDINASGNDWDSHIQIHRGIPKMEKIIGAKGYHPEDYLTGKPERNRKLLKYQGLTFLQLATESESKFAFK